MCKTSQMFNKIVIGGGTGFIGRELVQSLRPVTSSITIISRRPGPDKMTWNQIPDKGLPKGTSAVVNLSGLNVFHPYRKWTTGFKEAVISSRVNNTKTLSNAIQRMSDPPKVFVTISGVGFYRPSTTHVYTEDSEGGDDFMAQLCRDWENAAKLPPELGVRNVIIRSGVVLGDSGGILRQMYTPFRLGFGGRIGSGKQYFPWIHIEDLVNLFLFAIEEEHVSGVLNGVSPQTITNREFTKAIGRTLYRPTVISFPEFMVKIMYGKERAVMMTEGQKVIPKRVLDLGFKYLYPDINSACISLLT